MDAAGREGLAARRDRSATFFLLLALPATAMGLALSVQISVLSWMLATRYGLDIHEIGVISSALGPRRADCAMQLMPLPRRAPGAACGTVSATGRTASGRRTRSATG